ncbi:tumor necrosis factor receptor superfamily member 11B-like [Thalassophryne amazonica]|uniref:tumor necrosis factor receptor superfamily member 11B-like n=1 Tax=Thalassophryne amazonica TaxID=390379 RepID=UPI0014721A19|nr:tumor necrosis factor receptor superfamily member 11B-like [Thalassophryne amazonica]
MLLLPALLLVFPAAPLMAGGATPTYKHHNPETGELLTCDKCPPGTHMAAHCTATTSTVCVPCRKDHFTDLWNFLPRCLYCDNFCIYNLEVEAECSPVSNRVCRCQEGFYWTGDFCVHHTECGPGHGVRTKGTPQMNTVCEKCSNVSFSHTSSATEPCIKHTECTTEQTVLFPGSVFHDTVCGSCEDLTNGGDFFRSFLSGFFSTHSVRVRKMKKFVSRHIQEAGIPRRSRGTALHRQRVKLLEQIKAWLAHAPEEQLRQVPQMLTTSRLTSLADKLEKRLSDIQRHGSNCGLAT